MKLVGGGSVINGATPSIMSRQGHQVAEDRKIDVFVTYLFVSLKHPMNFFFLANRNLAALPLANERR